MQRKRPSTGWKAWSLELWAMAGSFLAFAAMVVLLAVFDGRRIFDWNSVTLNAIISVISISMRATLTFAIAEALGQWKWIIFSEETRALMDFERIDLASRGPLGSVAVLFKMNNGLWPLQLAALVILLAIAFDPFSQQLLQLQQGTRFIESPWSDEQSVFTTRTEGYDKGDVMRANTTRSAKEPGMVVFTVTTRLDLSMQAAILNGLSSSREMVDQQVRLQCPTGICSWGQFQTLGVCHRCRDISSDLKRVDNFGDVANTLYDEDYGSGAVYQKQDATAFVLPNGHFLVNINGCTTSIIPDFRQSCEYVSPKTGGYVPTDRILMSSFGTGDPNKTNAMRDIDTLIWSMSLIHSDRDEITNSSEPYKWPNVPISATECAIYYCVKTIESKVEQNVIHENVTEATDAKLRDPDSWNLDRSYLEENFAPEMVPPDGQLDSLEFHEHYSYFPRPPLVLHFPATSSKPKYEIQDAAVYSLNHFSRQLFSTNITGGAKAAAAVAERLQKNDSVGYNGVFKQGRGMPAAVGNIWNPGKLDIPNTFATLATSMTNTMRDTRYETGYEHQVRGLKGIPTSYYNVQWGWIALHGVVLVGGILVLYATVKKSDRTLSAVPAWKNSSLVVIRQGSSAAEVLKGTARVQEMEVRAQKTSVRMPLDNEQADDGHESDTKEDSTLTSIKRWLQLLVTTYSRIDTSKPA